MYVHKQKAQVFIAMATHNRTCSFLMKWMATGVHQLSSTVSSTGTSSRSPCTGLVMSSSQADISSSVPTTCQSTGGKTDLSLKSNKRLGVLTVLSPCSSLSLASSDIHKFNHSIAMFLSSKNKYGKRTLRFRKKSGGVVLPPTSGR